ncbi:MAG: ATP-dependent sacrificial sulfur transferase LarE [Myxococcales bacterium]|nr:ATP-dependent sacrificial sulfur transferase LarE [Myxococcales bacterium]
MSADYQRLIAHLRDYKRAAIAFSGGVDSSLLLAAAKDALGDEVLALIGVSPTLPQRELREAQALCDTLKVRYQLVQTAEMDDPHYRANSDRRCYYCKKYLYQAFLQAARNHDYSTVLEGSNRDDLSDYRPGMEALRELGIRSPFVELNIGKEQIRQMARERGLTVWDKPAAACLASRIPYGEPIDAEKLARIERAEDSLHDLGFRQVRARDHGGLVRIEAAPEDLPKLLDPAKREAVVTAMKSAGYLYVSLDLQGYRRGAMNEALPPAENDEPK